MAGKSFLALSAAVFLLFFRALMAAIHAGILVDVVTAALLGLIATGVVMHIVGEIVDHR